MPLSSGLAADHRECSPGYFYGIISFGSSSEASRSVLIFTNSSSVTPSCMNVRGFFLGDRRFPLNFASPGRVIVAHEQPHAVRQFQDALDGAVEHACVAAGKSARSGSTIGHKESIADKRSIADHVRHARRCVTGCVHREGLQIADLVSVAVFEEAIELTAIALEFSTFVENLPEDVLHDPNVLADADLSADLALDIGAADR